MGQVIVSSNKGKANGVEYIYKKYNKDYTGWSNEVYSFDEYAMSSIWSSYQFQSYSGWATWNSSKQEYENLSVYGYHYSARIYNHNNEELKAYRSEYYRNGMNEGNYNWSSNTYTRSRTIIKGTYIGEVIALDGTYPSNGLHIDGYWYIRDRLANSNSTLTTSISGGTLISGNSYFSKVNLG